jgi:transcription initiation factor TFIIIB Brf1 subunit/transcription initiation factor TFIIB
LVTEPDRGEFIRKDTGEDVSSDNALSQEKEWRAFELEGDISRARIGVPTFLAFHDMGISTIVRFPHAVGGRGGSIYHKGAYYGCIIISASASSTTTPDHGLGWNFS